MIAHSRLVFVTIIAVSSAMHLAAMTLIYVAPDVQMEGGMPTAQASLGASFADLAQGVQRPAEPSITAAAPVPVPAAPVQPVTPHAAPPVETPAQPPRQSSTASVVAAVTPAVKATPPVRPAETPAAPQTRTAPAETPPADSQAVVPETRVAALPQTGTAPPVSVRPQKSPDRPARQKPKPASKPAKPKGNAERNARAGTQTGSAAKPAQARQAAPAARQKTQGTAAASNYPGKVMARISRVPRPRTSAQGVAVVQFSIAANGSLGSVAIARSSGSAALDRAALAVLRKAQPFPPPPAGARRSYSIKIKGR